MSQSSESRPRQFGGARRVVVKIGSAVLSGTGRFDRVTFASLVRDLVDLQDKGLELVVVSSGAVALGMARLGLKTRPKELTRVQSLAAIGQGGLIRQWEDELGAYGAQAAQILVTHDDIKSRRRFLAARHTLSDLLQLKVLPIVNENDTVAFDEIKLGDNDLLSAQVVNLISADLLIILSDADGLYDRDPREKGARRLAYVPEISADLEAAAGPSGSIVGSGGMRTKLGAVRQVGHFGVPAIIAGGCTPGVLTRLYAGEALGTWFAPSADPLTSRKHWIAYAQAPSGRLVVDAGARRAVLDHGSSLLPVGVVEVKGEFDLGDVVGLMGPDGVEFARGLANHGSSVIDQVKGMQSDLAERRLSGRPVVVHRDDLVRMQ